MVSGSFFCYVFQPINQKLSSPLASPGENIVTDKIMEVLEVYDK
ncbi:hypothetical protein HMPREF1548_00160 [Clostridium sp. KLE 1755]|nr:hypothetical protein HMPREF1548_00160 [Clostridium sp. KLE 1755]